MAAYMAKPTMALRYLFFYEARVKSYTNTACLMLGGQSWTIWSSLPAPRAAIPKRDSVGQSCPRDQADRERPDKDRCVSMINIRWEFKT